MSGGAALEAWAAGRARRELRLLVERAPRSAHRYVDGAVVEVSVDELARATSSSCGRARSSRPTGVASRPRGRRRRVGAHGGGAPGPIARPGTSAPARRTPATRSTSASPPRGGSAYAAIVRLVAAAESDARPSRASPTGTRRLPPLHTRSSPGSPGSRRATPMRALAVMVVATPCPLILAAPIALRRRALARRAGRHHRQGRRRARAARSRADGAPRQDGDADTRRARGRAVLTARRLAEDEVLRLAASLEQHLGARRSPRRSCGGARRAGLALSSPRRREDPGQGIEGRVDGPRRGRLEPRGSGARGYATRARSAAGDAAGPRCSSASTAR